MKELNLMSKVFAGIAAVALLSGAALGQTWNEDGDAPDSIPGQATMGSGALTLINGSFASASDIDLYCISITDPANFRASTVGLTTNDTQLFLFDSNGNGVSSDDDDEASGGTVLQSTITSRFTANLQPGTFYIAVTTYNNDPDSNNGLIWNNTPYAVERAPDGPGAPGPLVTWTPAFGSSGTYGISFTGAGFCMGAGYHLNLGGTCPGTVTVSWSNATPNHQQAIVFGQNQGSTNIPPSYPCSGTTLGVAGGVMQVGSFFGTGGSGSGSINGAAGAFACGHYLQLVEGQTCNISNVAQIP